MWLACCTFYSETSTGVLKPLFQYRHVGLIRAVRPSRFYRAWRNPHCLYLQLTRMRISRKGFPPIKQLTLLLVGWAEWISCLAVQSPLKPTATTLPSYIKYEQEPTDESITSARSKASAGSCGLLCIFLLNDTWIAHVGILVLFHFCFNGSLAMDYRAFNGVTGKERIFQDI